MGTPNVFLQREWTAFINLAYQLREGQLRQLLVYFKNKSSEGYREGRRKTVKPLRVKIEAESFLLKMVNWTSAFIFTLS